MTTTIGELCMGYGGLGMGLSLALGGSTRVAWAVEYDKHPSAIITHRYPGVPNYGDVKTAPWHDMEPVDWLTAGYPCQPFSLAGLRKGADDPRHLWPGVAAAIRVLRPRGVLLENVAAHLRDGFDTVLGDLAAMGYDARWGVVRASDAGAPHGRARLFVVARHADGAALRERRIAAPGQAQGWGTRPDTCGSGRALPPAHAQDDGLPHVVASGRPAEQPGPTGSECATADAACDGRGEGRPEPARLLRRPHAPERGHADDGLTDHCGCCSHRRSAGCGGPACPCAPADAAAQRRGRPSGKLGGLGTAGRVAEADSPVQWGAYEPAVRRWERVTARPAPRPTEPGRSGERLSPAFVEWLMGLPEGWVTQVPGLPRNAQLKALGNGVVPQQAALACRLLGVTAEAVAA